MSVVGAWIAETPGTISLGQGVVSWGPPREAIEHRQRCRDRTRKERQAIVAQGARSFGSFGRLAQRAAFADVDNRDAGQCGHGGKSSSESGFRDVVVAPRRRNADPRRTY